jgi:hypothetical protein
MYGIELPYAPMKVPVGVEWNMRAICQELS